MNSNQHQNLHQRLGVTAAAFVVAVAGLVGVFSFSSPASASASGCTLAPGYTLAQNCIDVQGSGLTVNSSRSTYVPGASPWPSNLCSRTHQWRYTKNGGAQTTRTSTASSCIVGILNSYIDWSSPGVMKDQSSFCGRTKNSHTGGVYSNYACITIKK